MVKTKNETWFVVPNYGYLSDGPIALGSIIPSLSSMHESLNLASRVPIDDYIDQNVLEKYSNVTLEPERLDKWRKIVDLISGGQDKAQNIRRTAFECDELVTSSFYPTESYILQSIRNPDVQDYLQGSHRKKRLYMVTGVRIARGAKIRTVYRREGSISVPNTVGSGVPAALSTTVTASVQDESISWTKGADIVYAFRLHEIILTKRFGTGKSDSKSSRFSMKVDLNPALKQLSVSVSIRRREGSTPTIAGKERQQPASSSKEEVQKSTMIRSPPIESLDEGIDMPGTGTRSTSVFPFVLQDVSAENFGLKPLLTEDTSEVTMDPQTEEFKNTTSSYARLDLRRQSLDSGYGSSATSIASKDTELTTWDEYELEVQELDASPSIAPSLFSLPMEPPTVSFLSFQINIETMFDVSLFSLS
jgi:hypothetical protein